MKFEGENTEIEKKQIQWEEWKKDADAIVDGMGYRMDEGIKEPVISFWAHGFETTASCEGHLEELREGEGEPAPWIDLGEQPSDEVLEKAEEVKGVNQFIEASPELKEIRDKNLINIEPRSRLLGSF